MSNEAHSLVSPPMLLADEVLVTLWYPPIVRNVYGSVIYQEHFGKLTFTVIPRSPLGIPSVSAEALALEMRIALLTRMDRLFQKRYRRAARVSDWRPQLDLYPPDREAPLRTRIKLVPPRELFLTGRAFAGMVDRTLAIMKLVHHQSWKILVLNRDFE